MAQSTSDLSQEILDSDLDHLTPTESQDFPTFQPSVFYMQTNNSFKIDFTK